MITCRILRNAALIILAAVALAGCDQQDPQAVPYQAPQPQPQAQPPAQTNTCPPAGVAAGAPGYCTAQCPCDTGYSGCSADAGCKGGLKCVSEQVGTAYRNTCRAVETKKADNTTCAVDTECQSGRCGCSASIRGSLTCLASNVPAIACETGPKKNYWEACGDHAECQSSRCGCYAGSPSQMVCLSGPVTASSCVAPQQLKPLYTTCSAGSECSSGVCGCSSTGQTTMQCLPQGAQTTACGGGVKRGDFSLCGNDYECQSGHCGCFLGVELPVCVPALIGMIACPNNPTTAKKEDWQSCGGNGECKSNKCGCYGTTDQRCLPSSVVAQSCSQPVQRKPVGAACGYFEECQTHICGCSSASTTQKVCLTDTKDMRTCAVPQPQPTAQCTNWGTSGDHGQSCVGVPTETWRCVASASSFPGATISQVCRGGIWVTFHINPQSCSACCGKYSAACN